MLLLWTLNEVFLYIKTFYQTAAAASFENLKNLLIVHCNNMCTGEKNMIGIFLLIYLNL